MTKHYSLGFKFAAAYSLLCLLAVAYIVWCILLMPGKFELAGLVILALGLPWSLIFAVALSSLDRSLPWLPANSSAWLAAIGLVLSCIMNGWLLYRIGNKLPWGRS